MNFWEELNSRPDVGQAYSQDEIYRSLAPKQQPQKKKKKNFWTDQISTAGGILGGIGGSFVAPVAGTAGGAAAGSALGEAIENALMGESLGKNVVKEGALGGVLGFGPIKAAKGIAGLAAGKGVSGAAQFAQTPLRQTLGKGLTGQADDLAVKQFRLTPTQLNNFNKKFKEDAGTTIRKYGFHSVDDIQSKGIAPLQDEFDAAISSIPGVTSKSLQESFGKRIDKLVKSGPSDTQAVGKQLKREVDQILKGKGEVLDASEVNALRRQFDDLVNYTDRVANPTRYGVNKHMADGLRDALQKADPTGNLKLTGKELQKLRQLADNAGKQEQLGRGSLPLGLPTLISAAGGGAAGGPIGAAGMAIGTTAINSQAGRRATMAGFDKLGGGLVNSGAKAAGDSSKKIAKRVGAGGLASGYVNQAQQPQSLEDALSQSLASNANNPMNTPNAMNPNSATNMMDGLYQDESSSSSPYSRENLLADIQRDPENAADYIKYYSMLDEVFNPKVEEKKPLNQFQQERSDLLKAMDNTEAAVQGGSINYGPIGSRIEGIKGMFNAADKETLAFKNTISGLRAAITKARAGASLTEGELKMLQKYTPSETDSEQIVRSKLAQLRNLYGYQAPTQGGGSLEDALMQYGGQGY